jgi:hypothetical protein
MEWKFGDAPANPEKLVKDTTYDCQRTMVCPQYNSKIGHVNVLIQPLPEPHNERILKRELASRHTRGLMRNYFWIRLFTLY